MGEGTHKRQRDAPRELAPTQRRAGRCCQLKQFDEVEIVPVDNRIVVVKRRRVGTELEHLGEAIHLCLDVWGDELRRWREQHRVVLQILGWHNHRWC